MFPQPLDYHLLLPLTCFILPYTYIVSLFSVIESTLLNISQIINKVYTNLVKLTKWLDDSMRPSQEHKKIHFPSSRAKADFAASGNRLRSGQLSKPFKNSMSP
jgi:hypothetical protein